MKNSFNIEEMGSIKELSVVELTTIDGGGFWKDVFTIIGKATHFIVYTLDNAHKHPIRPSEYR